MKKIFYLLIFFLAISEIKIVSAQSKTIVPLGLSKFAAHQAVKEITEKKVYYFSSETYYDLDGYPSAYVFTFHKGGEATITEQRLLEDIVEARKMRVEGESLRERAYGFGDKEMIKKGHKMMKSALKKIRKDDEFITVVAGATYDQPPVILMFDGLPFHYTAREDAEELAMKATKRKGMKYKKGFYLGGYDFFLECGNDSENVFVDIYRKKIIPKNTMEEIKKKTEEKIISPTETRREEERIENVNKQWENIKEEFQRK